MLGGAGERIRKCWKLRSDGGIQMLKQYLLTKEVAFKLRRSPRTIYRYIQSGVLTPKKIMGGWLTPQNQITNLLNSNVSSLCQSMTTFRGGPRQKKSNVLEPRRAHGDNTRNRAGFS